MAIELPNYDMTIWKGFTKFQTFQYVEEDDITPIPLTNNEIKFFIRIGNKFSMELTSGEPKTPAGSCVQIIDRALGKFRLYITNEDTDLFPVTSETLVAKYWFGLIFPAPDNILDVEGRIYAMLKGGATIVLVA